MSRQFLRAVLTVLIDILVVIAVALAIRMCLVFSARLAAQGWAIAFDRITGAVVIPFGVRSIRTPYEGIFDVNCALTIVAALLTEWGLSVARDRA